MKSFFIIAICLMSFSSFAQDRPAPALNSVSETSLRTSYSNESDMDITEQTSLYLSDFDKQNKLAVLTATGDRTKPGSKDFIPYIKEKCDGGSCGMAPAPAGTSLDAVDLAKAKTALAKKSSASSIDKKNFKDGSVWIIQSEAPDKSGKKYAVTFAVELQKFAMNAKTVFVKYKVLEFVKK